MRKKGIKGLIEEFVCKMGLNLFFFICGFVAEMSMAKVIAG